MYYKLNNFFQCVPSSCYDNNCLECPTNRYNCTKCKLGFFSLLGVCISKCAKSMCAECKYDTISGENRCSTCNSGFTYYGIKY